MSGLKGLDRSAPIPERGELLKEWTKEIEEAQAKLRKDLTCPNCGGLMVYGEPCGPVTTKAVSDE